MRKTLFFILLFIITVNISSAQLTIKDTLLMGYKNEVFWSASSELEMGMYADFGKYGSTNLGDDDPSTCWAEGSENDGSGEFIWMTLPKNTQSLRIKNGYQKNENLFYANNRAKTLELELYACVEPPGFVTETHKGFFISAPIASSAVELEDIIGCQEVELGFNWPEVNSLLAGHETFDEDRCILKIKIKDVYKGDKWNDLCISDINIVPAPYFDIMPEEHGMLKITGSTTDTLFYNPKNVYQVVEISADAKWIIFIVMPSDIENSRVETSYKLYNTERMEFVTLEDITQMFGFIKKSGRMYLEGSDKDFNDKEILLEGL